MYAVSTMAMNHRVLLREITGMEAPRFVPEREFSYDGGMPEPGNILALARGVLMAAGLDGAHGIGRPQPDGRVVIQRQDLITPRRLTYIPAERKVTVERMIYSTPQFLERFHRRRGFQHAYWLDNVWAVTVDLVIAALILWVLTGLWMWWELKVTRPLGALALAGGLAVFLWFVFNV